MFKSLINIMTPFLLIWLPRYSSGKILLIETGKIEDSGKTGVVANLDDYETGNRISGGHEALPNAFPWIVRIAQGCVGGGK
jgi:hypothetical protein